MQISAGALCGVPVPQLKVHQRAHGMGAKDVFSAVGLGTPFFLAAVTYGFFFWLDRNASAQATRAISAWLKGEPYRRIDITRGTLAAFDFIYTSPLLRPRAFIRSSILSVVVFIAWYSSHIIANAPMWISVIRVALWPYVLMLIISDYISLFFVRGCLRNSGSHFLMSLVFAEATGILIIISALAVGIAIETSQVYSHVSVAAMYQIAEQS
jgi:hypothetical protein